MDLQKMASEFAAAILEVIRNASLEELTCIDGPPVPLAKVKKQLGSPAKKRPISKMQVKAPVAAPKVAGVLATPSKKTLKRSAKKASLKQKASAKRKVHPVLGVVLPKSSAKKLVKSSKRGGKKVAR